MREEHRGWRTGCGGGGDCDAVEGGNSYAMLWMMGWVELACLLHGTYHLRRRLMVLCCV